MNPKVIIDTSYLLPIFGVEVKTKIKLIDILRSYIEIYYNPISLVEIKWVLYRIVRRGLLPLDEARKSYREGLDVLFRDKRFRQTSLTSSSIEEIADKLEDLGLRDYFDRLIAATAIAGEYKLITEDKELIKILKDDYRYVILENI